MYASEAADIDARCEGGRFGIELGAEALDSVGLVGFDVEWSGRLAVESFNDLAERVVEAADRA